MTKTPFILVEKAISPEACNDIITSLDNFMPNYINDIPSLTVKANKLAEQRLSGLIDDLLDYAEPYYGFETQKISDYMFEWYPEGYRGTQMDSDAYTYQDGKWNKRNDVDFTILLFLSNSVIKNIQNRDTEFVGGGLQFPTHKFTLHPTSGDLLMFPSDNHFLNAFSDISLGNMNVVRVKITAIGGYAYDKSKFPGNYKSWFT